MRRAEQTLPCGSAHTRQNDASGLGGSAESVELDKRRLPDERLRRGHDQVLLERGHVAKKQKGHLESVRDALVLNVDADPFALDYNQD